MGIVDQKKVEFVQKYVPNFKKINALQDRGAVEQVKRDLHEAGYYRTPLAMIRDVSVQNIILAAQGKKPLRHVIIRKEGVMR
jgi:hypothetical protein